MSGRMDPVAVDAAFFHIWKSKDGRTKKSFFKEGTSMEMCYAGAIAMPSSYVVMNSIRIRKQVLQ